MTTFLKTFHVLCFENNKVELSYSPLYNYLKSNSSLVIIDIDDNGKDIKQLSMKYQYDNNSSDFVEVKFNNLNLNSILFGKGDDFISKVLLYLEDLDDITKNYLLNLNYAFGNNNDQKFLNVFLFGLTVVLGMYTLSLYKQNDINNPFDNIKLNVPLNEVNVDNLSQNLAEYVNHYARTLVHLPTSKLGKTWSRIHLDFWSIFNSLFPEGDEFESSSAAQDSILDFAGFINNKFVDIVNDTTKVEETTKSSVKTLEYANEVISEELKSVANESEEKIKDLTNQSVNNLVETKNKCLEEFNFTLFDELRSEKERSAQDIRNLGENILTEIENTVKFSLDTINKSVKNSQEELECTKDEILSLFRQKQNDCCDNSQVTLIDKPQLDENQIQTIINQKLNSSVQNAVKSVQDAGQSVLDTLYNSQIKVEKDMSLIKRNYSSLILRINKIEKQLLSLSEISSILVQNFKNCSKKC